MACCLSWLVALLAAAAAAVSILRLVPHPRPILGVYNQPGKWYYPKAYFIYFSILLRKWQAERKRKEEEGGASSPKDGAAGYGVGANKDFGEMESAQPLSEHKLAIDAVLFSCGGRDGTYLVAAMARRKLMMNQTIFCLRVPGVGVLLHPRHPDTTTFTDTESTWDAEGLRLDMVEPMKRWRLSYSGPMVLQGDKEGGRRVELKLEAEYASDLPHFDFDSDMDPWAVARAFAKEPWSREYFDRIKSAHQNHYEQFGRVTGTAAISDSGSDDSSKPAVHRLDLDVMRDHTHGSVRDWRLMHRYGINNFTTSSGLRGFVGVICQPSTFTSLEIGYVYEDGKALPVEEVDLPLWRHGEEGRHQPTDFAFRFRAGGRWREVRVEVLDSAEVFFGWEWEARVVERFARYTVDGVEGWGVSEWHWNWQEKGRGRPVGLEEKDPERVRAVKEKY